MSDTAGSAAAWGASHGAGQAAPEVPAPHQPAPGVHGGYHTAPGVHPPRVAGPAGQHPYLRYGSGQNRGPLGERRSIGIQVLLAIVTLGIYGFYWAYVSHDEIKRHSGEGVGGPLGLVIFTFLGVVSLFLLPLEIKRMYEREGLHSPVSGATAFWVLLFGIPWYVKCQSALNQYWAVKGAQA